jgi:D-inositol-3-phosphate glycosyltransferase
VKIVIVGPAFPFRGGIAETTNSLSAALTARGHDVVIAGFRKQFPKLLFPGKTQFVENKTARDLPAENLLVPWNPLSYWRTAKFISAQKPDLICFKWWMPFFRQGPTFGWRNF